MEEREEISFTGQCWEAGTNTLVVTIGHNIRKITGLEEGDLITVKITGIHKSDKEKNNQIEKRKVFDIK